MKTSAENPEPELLPCHKARSRREAEPGDAAISSVRSRGAQSYCKPRRYAARQRPANAKDSDGADGSRDGKAQS